MKSIKVLSLGVLVAFGAFGSAFAGVVDQPIGATAEITAAPTITPTDPAFGTIGVGSYTGTPVVSIYTNDTDNSSDSAIIAGDGSVGQIAVTGIKSEITSVTGNAGGGVIKLTTGAGTANDDILNGLIGLADQGSTGATIGTSNGAVACVIAANACTLKIGASITFVDGATPQNSGAYSTAGAGSSQAGTVTITYS